MKSLLLLCLFAPTVVHADDDNLLPANRPNFSSNAEVLPFQMVVLETGTTYQKMGSDKTFSGIEGELRIGFAKNWELDFFLPNYISGSSPRGWSDSGIQAVRQLPSCHGWNMVFAFGTSIPSGQLDQTAGAFNPNAYVSVDHDLGHDLQLTNTFYVTWEHFASVFDPTYANALMVSRDLGKGLGCFAEIYSKFAPGISPTQTFNFGYTFAHNANQQVDFHFGRSFEGAPSENWFVGAGYSVKLGHS